jgi:hypothetical protein
MSIQTENRLRLTDALPAFAAERTYLVSSPLVLFLRSTGEDSHEIPRDGLQTPLLRNEARGQRYH